MLVASFVQQAGDPFLERELSLLCSAVAAHFLFGGAGRISFDTLMLSRFQRLPARLLSRPAPRGLLGIKFDAGG